MSTAAAAARRTWCHAPSPGSAPLPGSCPPSFLESRSVAKATFSDYQRRAKAFLGWALQAGVSWTSVEELDLALVLYMDRLFFLGCAGDVASKTFAAV
eukprot:3190131-Pyramimonas_sp.AAC.1